MVVGADAVVELIRDIDGVLADRDTVHGVELPILLAEGAELGDERPVGTVDGETGLRTDHHQVLGDGDRHRLLHAELGEGLGVVRAEHADRVLSALYDVERPIGGDIERGRANQQAAAGHRPRVCAIRVEADQCSGVRLRRPDDTVGVVSD